MHYYVHGKYNECCGKRGNGSVTQTDRMQPDVASERSNQAPPVLAHQSQNRYQLQAANHIQKKMLLVRDEHGAFPALNAV